MTRMINVMVLPAGASASIRIEKIDGDDYRELNRLVDGNLGTCPLPPSLRSRDFYAFCDDDAMIRSEPRPPANRWLIHLGHARLRGPVVIVRTDHMGETLGLRRQDVAELEMYLAQEPSAEALHLSANEARFYQEHPSGTAIYGLDICSF